MSIPIIKKLHTSIQEMQHSTTREHKSQQKESLRSPVP